MRLRLAVCAGFLVIFLLVSAGLGLLAQDRKSQNSLSVSFPDKLWWIEVDSPGFSVKGKGQKPDGRQYLFANNPKTGVILSVMLEQSQKAAEGDPCSDYLQHRLQSVSKLGFVATDPKTSEVNSMDVLEYVIAKAQGMPVQQKNVFACMAKDDIYVDVHLSKAHFQPADEATLVDILNHVQVASANSSINAMAH
jgi:hypothetical protein